MEIMQKATSVAMLVCDVEFGGRLASAWSTNAPRVAYWSAASKSP